jgi:K+/H+ antiporter YhaU regulatory subunit KhtT
MTTPEPAKDKLDLWPNTRLDINVEKDGSRIWLELMLSNHDSPETRKVGMSLTADLARQIAQALNEMVGESER